MPLLCVCLTGPATITIYDIHALQSQFYFSDNVLVELKSAIFLLRQQLVEMDVDVAIAFPDDGAHKRFRRKFPEYADIVCKKTRNGEKRVVSVHEGDPCGRHVVIVDDGCIGVKLILSKFTTERFWRPKIR